ncbi:MAG: hypothetical protein KDA62_21015, partial [Planctomycetales bacterium]|nr:hypothetical protein [Planctomycetales bacterium]
HHADPWGQPNVSRIVVGGSLTELLIQTIGIAQSIDVGNFETEESAVVLLDLLSAAGNNPNSLNNIPRHPATTIVDVIGRAVGTIVTHEAGHFFGAWHQDNTNTVPMIMDSGGNFANTLGLGPDGIFGTDDDIEVNFGKDRYSLVEFFTGTEDTADGMAFGLSTGKVGSTISGIKFNDANGNGRRDTGEAGLAGFTIYADLNVNGILDAGEPRSVSDSTGAYSLQVPTGSLRIAEVQQAGYRQTFPAAPGIHTVTLTAGQTVTGINFGNQAIVAQAVGTKWLDTDGDGVKDAGEPGIAGVWIYVDLDQDGRIDTGEPATVTNQFGQYTLALPGAGTYQLREVLGPGYVQTFPGGNGAHTVTVTGTETVGRDFGNMPAFDYGDAPVDYVSLTLAGEARHGVLQGFHLGAAVDGESGPQSSNDALGDDNAGQDDGTGTNTIIDDEDGVIIPGPFYIGKTGSVTVNVETGSIAPGMLQGWIDYNRDGVWSDNEQIVKNRTLGTGSHVVTFTVP